MNKIYGRRLLKVLIFIILFITLFWLSQEVLHKKWNDRNVRINELKSLSDEEVDILCIGTSELWAAYDPIVTYHEKGITGYNLAINYHSAITAYYQLLQALEYHTPKIVLCDFCSLYEDNLPSESSKIETLYCEVFDTLDSTSMKWDMLKDLYSVDKDINIASWIFPLLRYHNMWNEVSYENFISDEEAAGVGAFYKKGSRLQSTYQYDDVINIKPENWYYDEEEKEFSEISMEYYDKFIEKCQENDIIVVAVFPPKLDTSSEFAARLSAEVEYFVSRGVYCLNYNTYEQVERLGLNHEIDYYDEKHLNTIGSVKFSKALANDLKMYWDLPDRRNEENVAQEWNNAYEQFKYNMMCQQPTISYTIEMASEFGYRVCAEIVTQNDEICSKELTGINKRFDYDETIKNGLYIYDADNSTVTYFNDSESTDNSTQLGNISRIYDEENNRYIIYLDEMELLTMDWYCYETEYNTPYYYAYLCVLDDDNNVLCRSAWECDYRNDNSKKIKSE